MLSHAQGCMHRVGSKWGCINSVIWSRAHLSLPLGDKTAKPCHAHCDGVSVLHLPNCSAAARRSLQAHWRYGAACRLNDLHPGCSEFRRNIGRSFASKRHSTSKLLVTASHHMPAGMLPWLPCPAFARGSRLYAASKSCTRPNCELRCARMMW